MKIVTLNVLVEDSRADEVAALLLANVRCTDLQCLGSLLVKHGLHTSKANYGVKVADSESTPVSPYQPYVHRTPPEEDHQFPGR